MNYATLESWLCDYYLLATPLLAAACALVAAMRQPARRLSVVWATSAGLALLAALSAVPGWSVVHLLQADAPLSARDEAINQAASPDPEHAQEPRAAAPVPMPPRPAVVSQATDASTAAAGESTPRASWKAVAFRAAGIGSVVACAWLAIGCLRAARLLGQSRRASPALAGLLLTVAGARRTRARLLVNDSLPTPVALGLARPKIILPAEMAQSEMSSETTSALAHELAHVRNGDLWLLAALRALTLVLWAHPLLWLLRRTVRRDQETLADAAAAKLTTRHDYAQQLVGWAKRLPAAGAARLAPAVGLWEGPSQLKRRVALLLDDKFTVLGRCSRGWRALTLTACAAGALGLSFVTLAPAQPDNAPSANASADEEETQAETDKDALFIDGTVVFFPLYTAGHAGAEIFHFEQGPHEPNTIEGECVDSEGEPLADVKLTVYRTTRQGSVTTVATTKSNARGAFSLANVIPREDLPREDDVYRPGDPQFAFVVQRPGWVSNQFQSRAQMFADGLRLTVTLAPAATLTGVVTGPDGKPVSGAMVTAARGGVSTAIEGVQTARTDEEGRYEIRDATAFDMDEFKKRREEQRGELNTWAPVGATATLSLQAYNVYLMPPVLQVSHPDFATAKAPYEAIPGVADVRLKPAVVIDGRLLDPDGEPAAGRYVTARTAFTPEELQKLKGDEAVYRSHSATAVTDAEGRYRFTSLPAGEYDIYAEPYDWASPMPEWLPAGVSHFQATGEGAAAQVPNIRLQRGGVIEIQLTDAETGEPLSFDPPGHAWVAIEQPGAPAQISYRSAKAPCGHDGLVRVRSIPGEVTVSVYGAGQEQNPVWRAPGGGGGERQKATVTAGETTRISFALEDHTEQDKLVQELQRGAAALEEGNADEALRIWTAVIDKGPGGRL